MYIQITTRCQMSCAHCCYSCTKQGEDMSLDTFRRCLKTCREYDEYPFLGGGEPTLHPQFEKFLLEAIASNTSSIKVGIITNGGIKKRALMLASLTKQDIIMAQLSRDEYHDPIDDEVVEAFCELTHGIRDTSRNGTLSPLPHGRGRELLQIEGFEDYDYSEVDCCCPDILVKPNGDVYQCGCEHSPLIGNVHDSSLDIRAFGDCWLSPEYQEETVY